MQIRAIIFLLIAGIYAQNANAQLCSDPIDTVYGVEMNGDIVPINDNNAGIGGPLTNSGDAGYPGSTSAANAIGLDIQNGTFYFFQNNRVRSQQFVSFNPATKKYTVLAKSPILGTTVKGCVSADGTGYYCLDGSGKLSYYSIISNTWASIGSNLVDQFGSSLDSIFSALGNGDITIDGLGNLWIVAASNTQWGLYRISAPLPTTPLASVTLEQMVPPTQPTPSGLPFVGICYSATGQIYMCTTDDLYELQLDMSVTHVHSFSTPGVVVDLTSCNYPFGVLPLGWSGFTAFAAGNKSVSLNWSLYQQINNKGYYIERSVDGKNWDSIGYQVNKPSAGEIVYTFTDERPNDGINYYRIGAMDFNGNITYSKTNMVDITNVAAVNIWPVPAKNFIYVQIAGVNNSKQSSITIFNHSGQKVISYLPHGGTNTIDVSSLPPGYYFMTIHFSDGTNVQQKLIKL